MPLYDEDGKVVENVITKDEAEKQTSAAVEAATKKLMDEKASVEKDLSQVKVDLEKATAGDKNWKELREKKEALEGKVDGIEQKLKSQEERAVASLKASRERMILELADNDADTAKKIQLAYDQQTAGAEDSEESIRTRVNNAYVLYKSQGQKPGAFSPSTLSSAGGGRPTQAKQPVQLDAEAQNLAGKLGVSSESLKKYNERHKGA